MMHELPLQENGDNLEERHFTTALTLMAEVETEQSLKMRVNPSGISQTGRRGGYNVRKPFQNKSCTQGSNQEHCWLGEAPGNLKAGMVLQC